MDEPDNGDEKVVRAIHHFFAKTYLPLTSSALGFPFPLTMSDKGAAGLPDGIFSNTKSHFG
jgi:hypothetical protein